MSIFKAIFIGSLALFVGIGGLALVKKSKEKKIDGPEVAAKIENMTGAPEIAMEEHSEQYLKPVQDEVADQEEDQVWRLFTTGRQKLPIVETIRYKALVSWLQGRPAWVSDYASHYSTSRHFIARSLNRKKDYYTQKITPGDQFNILKKDVSFSLVVDLSRCKMWFYGIDESSQERILLKTYKVGLGRFDQDSYSGLLTPKGKFSLGDKVAIYKPGMEGYFQETEVEMVRVFGTRWIPFSEEISGEGDNPRGYGFHGAPWVYDVATKTYKEDLSTVGRYDSDGCIRLAQNDIEELYSIVITKPTVVEIVSDFHDAEVPGERVKK
ncbi:MAG: L,D-transpeptidase [Simkaniaceae bacterium]|nr:L,D-transpeptidase [Simkaniaceae bacterium]